MVGVPPTRQLLLDAAATVVGASLAAAFVEAHRRWSVAAMIPVAMPIVKVIVVPPRLMLVGASLWRARTIARRLAHADRRAAAEEALAWTLCPTGSCKEQTGESCFGINMNININIFVPTRT